MYLPARLLAGLGLALCAATATPQTPGLYTVEVLVFRHAGTIGALPDNSVSPATIDDGIEAMPAVTAKLTAAARRLTSAGVFRVLAHTAWTQRPTVFPSYRGVSATQLGLGNGIAGKIGLERGTYLNLRLDLTLEDAGRRYRLNEVRPVKTDEINYFDHPAIGVLAIVTAVSGN